MDGKTIRLRASCNACNESKVRCSQHKPTCARCERNGTECIYGLSRRTHKDAPPISMPPSQRPSRSSSNADSKSNSNWRGMSFPKSATATPSNRSASPDRSARTHDTALFGDYMSPAGTHFMISSQQQQNEAAATSQAPTAADSIHRAGLLPDFSSLIDPLSAAVTRFPTPGAEYANPWVLGSLFGGSNNNSDSDAANDMAMFWARQMVSAGPMTTASSSPECGECNCHAGVTELLASIRGGGDDHRRLSLDAQLAKLKRCIASSETSIGCAHGREDAEPIHIMAVATLIGYVIDEFEMLANETPLRRSSPGAMACLGDTERGSSLSSGSDESVSGKVVTGANMSLRGFLEPRLSWGVLELEDDDEVDLRQRLYLLSFRKLERLLWQLTLYLRNLHDARASLPGPSRHMAFVMACDYTRLWLEKKAEDVKRLFSMGAGDETVDPALA